MKISRNIKASFLCCLGMTAMLAGCGKSELPPSIEGDPVLFVKGKFRNHDINMMIDDSAFLGLHAIMEDPINTIRSYWFQVNKYTSSPVSGLVFQFVNYKTPYGDLNTDIDSTFIPGNKMLSPYFPSGTNPFNLNTMTISVDGTDGNYTSQLFFNDSSYVLIDSVRDNTWRDGITYKMIYLSFSANLRSANIMDSLYYPFTEGKALIAFPKD
ncbi:MAG: hypothetical protein AB9842_02605 [Bacteroidales bacterium]